MQFVSVDPVFEIRSALADEQLPIYRMLELYQHDLSDVWDQDLNTHGEYGYALDEYWLTRDCNAFVVLVESRYAGVALVNRRPKMPGADHWLEQFFIIKKYRRRGIGAAAAGALFDSMPGVWQVGQMPLNKPAQAFWRRVVAQYTGGSYQEQRLESGPWQGLLQQFKSPSPNA
jgi:predicted acetyltransferase